MQVLVRKKINKHTGEGNFKKLEMFTQLFKTGVGFTV